ncbi:uncharacterized protein LOC112465473 [Temnothorax curvispinosus]|uniref:Uncharacterized protein LOC112465473 n=1 Tax=Temnothorax curvispinosus TaxID=300111 RepID=A0A6J1R1D1_9HYME|nr:uncharacterized protein LOC112465473 [Temnothorax curvispinosus]
MLKDKVFSKSAAYPFSKIFHFGQEVANRVCRFCKKTFCCVKCHDRHVDKAHPDVNPDCFLCASEILPMRQCESAKLNSEDEKLLSHIIDKHLPLRCRLCGDLFVSREDFKSIAACKWFERWRCLTSPTCFDYLEKNKLCSISESDCNGSRFCTPPEIYRKTSTPMFIGQKAGFETPCVPEFTLKTPKPSSPYSIAQIASISNDTQFFSFVLHASSEETPFRTCRDEDFFKTSNSFRKLCIMEEEEKTAHEEAAEKITANEIKVSSPVDMDLTSPEGGILQDSPQSDDVREDVVKKVRFSDQFKTAAGETRGINLTDSCVRTILNTSMEEEEDDEFHDANNEINARKAKTTAEDIKDAKNADDTNNVEDTRSAEGAKSTNDSEAEDKTRSSIQLSENLLSNSEIRIIQGNTKNAKKENRDPEVSDEVAPTRPTSNQRDSNSVVVVVMMESNSGGLTNDLIISGLNQGLNMMKEQIASANCQAPSVSAPESANVCRRSITTMRMSVSSVESYSPNRAEMMTNHGQLAPASFSSSVQSGENNNSSGFLSTFTQAMKHAFRSFSVSGLRIPPRSIEATEVMQRREIVEELTSSQELSSSANNSTTRPGKRTREVTEGSSREGSIAFALDIRSPLAKRQKGWYKMIRGRQPIGRMRNSRVPTSPRGVSAETQVFSQGSLTVGDTVLPLPVRAHQSTE